jgi:hypothetical protein
VFHQGAEKLVVSGLGTDLSRNGMALYAGLNLKAGDPIEVEFRKIRDPKLVKNLCPNPTEFATHPEPKVRGF